LILFVSSLGSAQVYLVIEFSFMISDLD